MLVLRLRSSLSELQLGRKNNYHLNFILHNQTALIDSYIIQPGPHQEARQSQLILPSCLDRHAMHSHKNGGRVPSTPPLYPPAPAGTRDGAGLARGAMLWVHARTQDERRKKEKKALADK